MASSVSYEFLNAVKGALNGIASLDASGLIPTAQLPPAATSPYKGVFASVADLPATGVTADYAFVTGLGFYYWNAALITPGPGWVAQEITEADYLLLTTPEIIAVPYLVIPTP